MPELEEVFRLSTTNLRREPGAMDRQVEKQRKAARNRKLGAIAVVAVVIAAGGAAVAVIGGNSNGAPASQGPSASPSQVLVAGQVTSSMIDIDTGVVTPLPSLLLGGDSYPVSPDHTQVAFTASNALYVADIDGTNVRQVSPTGVDAFGPQWSPDGTKLVYQQRDATTIRLGNLFVLDVATGTETRITDLDQSQRYGWWFLDPSFEPDGQHVLYQLPSGDQRHAVWNLWTVAVTGGHASIVQRNAGWGAVQGAGGQNLAYVTPVSPSDFHGAQLMIGSTDGGDQPRLLAEGSIVAPRWSPDGSRIAYQQGGWVDVVNVATGAIVRIVHGSNPQWFDDHTVIVGG